MDRIVNHIEFSVDRANSNQSKLTTDILSYTGFTGTKTRHFYNNLAEAPWGVRYLEIGTWFGSSSISALYKNPIERAVFIDNWCQFGGTREVLETAINKYKMEKTQCDLVEQDCWKVDTASLGGTFNLYLYDGEHSEQDQFLALKHYLPVLEDKCIVLVDDWAWTNVQNGTRRAFKELGLNVLYEKEILPTPLDYTDKAGWWNGIGIFVIGSRV